MIIIYANFIISYGKFVAATSCVCRVNETIYSRYIQGERNQQILMVAIHFETLPMSAKNRVKCGFERGMKIHAFCCHSERIT